jgi:hypothetical protein
MQDAGRDERSEAVTVAEASERLGISKEAIRKRVSRGTLHAEKDPDGTVRVYAPPSDTTSGTADRAELVEILREQVADLRRERDEWREQARMIDRLLAAALERIPELPAATPSPGSAASSEPREAPEMADDEQQGRGPVPDTGGSQTGAERGSWWRRVFGG